MALPVALAGQLILSDLYCSGHHTQREESGQLTCVNIASLVAAGEQCGPGTNCHGDTAQLPRHQPPEDTQLSPTALLEGNFKSTTTQFNSKFAAQLG